MVLLNNLPLQDLQIKSIRKQEACRQLAIRFLIKPPRIRIWYPSFQLLFLGQAPIDTHSHSASYKPIQHFPKNFIPGP